MFVILCILAATAGAPADQPVPPVQPPQIVKVRPDDKPIRLGDWIYIELQNLDPKADPAKFELSLNDFALPALKPRIIGQTLRFRLERPLDDSADGAKATRESWNALIGSPTGDRREVRAHLKYNGTAVAEKDAAKTTLMLQLFDRKIVVAWSLAIVVLLIAFWLIARSTNLLRDTVPPTPKNGKRPYSLGRSQMAFWFLVILISFIFIFVILRDWHGILNDEALILMGIGVGTALGGTMIEVVKRNNALSTVEVAQADAAVKEYTTYRDALPKSNPPTQLELQMIADANVTLAGKQAAFLDARQRFLAAQQLLHTPTSVGFFQDILTDADGANVHRFQMLAWTVVLGVVYLYGVWKTLSLPDFPAAINALLGISAGTYLGFKVPEKQA